jgi:hypothetical protein
VLIKGPNEETVMAGRANFLASHNGFAFSNSWPKQPAVTLDTPFGPIKVGDASKGLCGGMAFAALDYWYADSVPPTDRPPEGSPLYKFLVKRIVDSWHVPAGVAQYFQWMNLPDSDQGFTAFGQHIVTQRGLPWRTITQQLPLIRADLDANVPCPLGLVTVHSSSPQELGKCHQVLAYAYRIAGSQVTIDVYDPNSGQDDDVTITFDKSHPTKATTFTHTIGIPHPIRGFFRTAYAPVSPPA